MVDGTRLVAHDGDMNASRHDAEQLGERRAEIERLTTALTRWARHQPAIRAVGIVGSWGAMLLRTSQTSMCCC